MLPTNKYSTTSSKY